MLAGAAALLAHPAGSVDAKELIPVTDPNVKSHQRHAGRLGDAESGAVVGVAWSHGAAIAKVEISDDGGKRSPIARATDSAGRAQPMPEEWNPFGYLWNVAQTRVVTVSPTKPSAPLVGDAGAPIPPVAYAAACHTHHDDHMMRQQRMTCPQREKEMDKVAGWGAEMKPDDRTAIVDFLSAQCKGPVP